MNIHCILNGSFCQLDGSILEIESSKKRLRCYDEEKENVVKKIRK